ncbi:hypothetical protein KXX03_002898 [Aspergillus fumigatus]|nr:hypothetical protein KXX03_002898 [Aspergillus fumigatus]
MDEIQGVKAHQRASSVPHFRFLRPICDVIRRNRSNTGEKWIRFQWDYHETGTFYRTDLVFLGRESPMDEASQVTFANHGFRMSVPKATTIQATHPQPPNCPFS